MKKVLMGVLSLTLLLGGCSAGNKTVDLEEVIVGVQAIEDAPSFVVNGAEEIESMMGIAKDQYTSSAVLLPLMNINATEVVLFQYETEEQKTAIKKGIDERIEQLDNVWKQYLPDQYELVKNRKTYDANHIYGYVIGEEAFKKSVDEAITNAMK